MHGYAYVFPTGLEYAIERLYPGRHFQIISEPGEINRHLQYIGPDSRDTFYFIYSENGAGPGHVVEKKY